MLWIDGKCGKLLKPAQKFQNVVKCFNLLKNVGECWKLLWPDFTEKSCIGDRVWEADWHRQCVCKCFVNQSLMLKGIDVV